METETPESDAAWNEYLKSDFYSEDVWKLRRLHLKLEAERDRDRKALYAIYNHNAACRVAVIQYYGLNHDYVMIPLENAQGMASPGKTPT